MYGWLKGDMPIESKVTTYTKATPIFSKEVKGLARKTRYEANKY